MASEPKRRHSKTQKRVRRAAIMLESASLITCTNCGVKTRPHIACANCGFYKRSLLTPKGQSIRPEKVQITKA